MLAMLRNEITLRHCLKAEAMRCLVKCIVLVDLCLTHHAVAVLGFAAIPEALIRYRYWISVDSKRDIVKYFT